ncbi:hypothetical protein D6833_01835, partial [Candidatus Parcubacteria bacterium]
MTAVIVAAGRGSRLMNHHPKTMMNLDDRSILEHIVTNLKQAGVTKFVIVLGYQARMLQDFLLANDYFGLQVQTVYNPDWQRGNGISVLCAEELVGRQPFILSMSDHIVSPTAVRRVLQAKDERNLL